MFIPKASRLVRLYAAPGMIGHCSAVLGRLRAKSQPRRISTARSSRATTSSAPLRVWGSYVRLAMRRHRAENVLRATQGSAARWSLRAALSFFDRRVGADAGFGSCWSADRAQARWLSCSRRLAARSRAQPKPFGSVFQCRPLEAVKATVSDSVSARFILRALFPVG